MIKTQENTNKWRVLFLFPHPNEKYTMAQVVIFFEFFFTEFSHFLKKNCDQNVTKFNSKKTINKNKKVVHHLRYIFSVCEGDKTKLSQCMTSFSLFSSKVLHICSFFYQIISLTIDAILLAFYETVHWKKKIDLERFWRYRKRNLHRHQAKVCFFCLFVQQILLSWVLQHNPKKTLTLPHVFLILLLFLSFKDWVPTWICESTTFP